jgi:two-component system phosphate regulon response regulator PhoB
VSGAPASAGERILVVDDEADIISLVVYHLVKHGYRVSTASDGIEAVRAAKQELPSLVILDLMLPGKSGYDVLEELRATPATRDIAVLMLTARKEEEDRIRGLALGADDYLTKPFSPQELVLRVGAILRRMTKNTRADVIAIGPIEIDRGEHRVRVDGHEVDLTATEYKLHLLLAERRGRVQDRAKLLESVWDAAPDIQTRTVDMHVQRLRSKLGSAGDLVETVRGFGYRLRAGHGRS